MAKSGGLGSLSKRVVVAAGAATIVVAVVLTLVLTRSNSSSGSGVVVAGPDATQVRAIYTSCAGHYDGQGNTCDPVPAQRLTSLCNSWISQDLSPVTPRDLQAPHLRMNGQPIQSGLGPATYVSGPGSTAPLVINCSDHAAAQTGWIVTVGFPTTGNPLTDPRDDCSPPGPTTTCEGTASGEVSHLVGSQIFGDMYELHTTTIDISASVINAAVDQGAVAAKLFNTVAQRLGIDATVADTATSTATSTPAESTVTSSSSAESPSDPLMPVAGATLRVLGLDNNTYPLSIVATDTITDCASHSYGTAMTKFLRAHPCGHAQRVLATVPVQGREAVLSEIWVDFPPTTGDPNGYNTNGQFQELENADGSGSINDLLREGHPVPGIATAIPQNEAFLVTGQDATAVVLDAWWAHGVTDDQDPTLLAAEQALSIWSAPQDADPSQPTSASPSATPRQLATAACQAWQSNEDNGSAATDDVYEDAAARKAASAGPTWTKLAAAMMDAAGLPNTSLTSAQMQAVKRDSSIIKSQCATLGITISY